MQPATQNTTDESAYDRREFLFRAAAAGLGLATLPGLVEAAESLTSKDKIARPTLTAEEVWTEFGQTLSQERLWMNKSGKTCMGRFMASSNEKVALVTSTGIYAFPIDTLSADDQKLLEPLGKVITEEGVMRDRCIWYVHAKFTRFYSGVGKIDEPSAVHSIGEAIEALAVNPAQGEKPNIFWVPSSNLFVVNAPPAFHDKLLADAGSLKIAPESFPAGAEGPNTIVKQALKTLGTEIAVSSLPFTLGQRCEALGKLCGIDITVGPDDFNQPITDQHVPTKFGRHRLDNFLSLTCASPLCWSMEPSGKQIVISGIRRMKTLGLKGNYSTSNILSPGDAATLLQWVKQDTSGTMNKIEFSPSSMIAKVSGHPAMHREISAILKKMNETQYRKPTDIAALRK